MPSEPGPVQPVIALDIGNVCVHLKLEREARAFGFDSMDGFRAGAPVAFAVNELFECGEIDLQQFLCELRRVLPSLRDWSDERIIDAYRCLVDNEIEGMATLVDEWLAAGIRPVFFSDINPVHWRQVQGLMSFVDKIPDAVLSFKTGACKPNPPMYIEMETLHCGGGRPCLYLDDKPDNIAAGRARGWHCYQVGDLAGIRAAMKEIAL
jgi:FMN phosphatase YigB (HAD superfamily)